MNLPLATTSAICLMMAMAPAEEKISIQFLSFPKTQNLEPIELLVGEEKTIDIYIPGHELSPVYKVDRMATIAVGRTVTMDDGTRSFQVLGRAPSISADRQIILLLRKGPENSDGFRVLPINGQLDEFKGGTFMVFNAMNVPAGGMIGDEKFALNPGQRRLIKPKATHAGGGCQVTLAYQHEDEWNTFFDTRWTVNERFRSMVFFVQDPETQRIGISTVVDVF